MLLCQILLGTPDIISQAQYALDVKAKVLPIYEQVFGIEYPLPKLDTLVVRHPRLFLRDAISEYPKGT